jgi:hypothetical protein
MGMGRNTRTLLVAVAIAAVVAVVAALAVQQWIMLRRAHSTFENYYAFRGCALLLQRTADYGLCRLPSGQVIKLVHFRGRWYLDGDLPTCFGAVCLFVPFGPSGPVRL